MKIVIFFLFIIISSTYLNCDSIAAWGGNYSGELCIGKDVSYEEPVKVMNMSNAGDISAGQWFSLALKDDGSVWAWGANDYGQLGISLDGCSFEDSPKNLPQKVNNYWLGNDVKKIITSNFTSFAVKEDGSLWWWGKVFDEEGYFIAPYPIKINLIDNVDDFFTDGIMLIAKKKDGSVWAWGGESYGGDPPSGKFYASPVRVEDFDNAIAITEAPIDISPGPSMKLVLKEDGSVWEWMLWGHRRKVIEDIKAIAGSLNHALVVKKDGTVLAWGDNYFGELGNGTNKHSYKPVMVNGLTDVIDVEVGYENSFALRSDGTVWAWGLNNYGQLGDGTNINRNIPVKVLNLKDIVKISALEDHNLALDRNGFIWAWGYNEYGQIGNGYDTVIDKFKKIKNLKEISKVSSGAFHSLFLNKNGEIFACGNTEYGQLGIGIFPDEIDKKNINEPVKILIDAKIISISAGWSSSYGLDKDGFVWVWGSNRWGQLGIGSSLEYLKYPIKNPFLEHIIEIDNCLALKNDGTVWAWGSNESGQLGDGTFINKNYPVKVKIEKVKQISSGAGHKLALKEDGTVWAWGWNRYGQLGIGNNIDQNVPVQVLNLKDIVKISAGATHSLALDKYGKLWGWGSNDDGQLGLNEVFYDVPIQIGWPEDIKDLIADWGVSVILEKTGNLYYINNNQQKLLGENVTSIFGRFWHFFTVHDSEHDLPF